MIVPVAGAGLFIACMVILATRQPPRQTASEVRTKISEVVLHQSTKPGAQAGGAIGPWWVSASGFDPHTNVFENLRITSDQLHVAAETAELKIDPSADTFTFELDQVVLFDLDDADVPDRSTPMRTIRSYTLGPIEYGVDIVPDGP